MLQRLPLHLRPTCEPVCPTCNLHMKGVNSFRTSLCSVATSSSVASVDTTKPSFEKEKPHGKIHPPGKPGPPEKAPC
jgi:hypothetical protein